MASTTHITGILCILMLIFPSVSSMVYSCEDCERQDNKGKEFIFGFLNIVGPDNYPKVTLVGSARRTTRVNVTMGVRVWHVTLDSHQYMKVVRIPGKTEGKAILIQSDYEITVYGIDEGNSMDSFLALPTDVLGKEYFVASYDIPTRINIKHRGSQFLVIGAHDDTEITIYLEGQLTYQGVTHRKGTVLVRTLSRLQSILFLSDQDDLTGTRITSNKPIVVISGSKCADVPRGVRYCDHLVEQLPPFSKWGKTFITTPLYNRTGGDRFRVIAGRDNTEVTLNNGESKTLNKGEFAEIDIKSTLSYVINSSKPILVMQYGKGGAADNTRADPFMMLVPAIEHFTHDVMLVTLDNAVNGQVLNNFANIIIECRQTVKLYHNMFKFPETEFQKLGKLKVTIGGKEFCMAQITLPHGVHYVDHRDQDVPFSVTIYGYGTQEAETAYGMIAGISFEPSARFGDTTQIELATGPPSSKISPGGRFVEHYTTPPDVKIQHMSTAKKHTIIKDITYAGDFANTDIDNPVDPTIGQVYHPYNPSSDVVLSLIIGTIGFTAFMVLTMYIILLKNRIHKLKTEAQYKRTNYGTSSMGPDGYMGLDGTQISHREYMSLNLPQGLFVRRSHSVPMRPALPPRMPITPLTKKNLRTHSVSSARSPESSTEIELNVLELSSVSTDLSHDYKTPKKLNLYKMLCDTPKRWQSSLRNFGRSMSESSAITASTDDVYMDMGRNNSSNLARKSSRHQNRLDSGFVESVSEEFFPVVSDEYSFIPNDTPTDVSANIGQCSRELRVASIGKRKRSSVSTVFSIPSPVLCPTLNSDTYYDVDAQEYTELH